MMFEFLVQLITSAAVSTVLAAALVWLSRLWISERLKSAIKSEYEQKLETHKAQLKAQSDIEIERLRSQLSIAATEHQVRFSRLHEKRAEVVAETYKLLLDLHQRLANYVSIIEFSNDPPIAERRAMAVGSHKSFIDFYAKRSSISTQKMSFFFRRLRQKCWNRSTVNAWTLSMNSH
jgi:hypothetical protein